MITYQVEHLRDTQEEVWPLLEAHLEELPMHTNANVYMDWDAYFSMCDTGSYSFITARDIDFGDKLVGYVGYVIRDSIVYEDITTAKMDCVFIDYDYRGNGIATDMIQFAEDVLSNLGVSVVDMSMHSSAQFAGLASTLGYEEKHITYLKDLRGNQNGL